MVPRVDVILGWSACRSDPKEQLSRAVLLRTTQAIFESRSHMIGAATTAEGKIG